MIAPSLFAGFEPHSIAPLMIIVVAPKPGSNLTIMTIMVIMVIVMIMTIMVVMVIVVIVMKMI